MQVIKCPSCVAPLKSSDVDNKVCSSCGSRIVFSPDTFSWEYPQSGLDAEQQRKLKEILATARSGNKISAIKKYRETFAVGLKDAKEAVEKLTDEGEVNSSFLNFAFQKTDGKYIAKQGANTGCALIFLAAIGLIIVTIAGIKVFI